MMSTSALRYYISSVFTLLVHFNWWTFPKIFFGKPVLIRIKNGPDYYASNLMDIWTLKEVVVDRQYEMVRKIPNKATVVDIGAAIGDFSIYASKKSKRVIAYECADERVLLMKKNIALNKVANIDLHHARATSLKLILKNISRCDFLKVDCEGGEYRIFRNADKPTMNKIRFISMEAHRFDGRMKKDYSDLLQKLKDNHFEVRTVNNPVHGHICFVFAHKRRASTASS